MALDHVFSVNSPIFSAYANLALTCFSERFGCVELSYFFFESIYVVLSLDILRR